MIRMTRSGLPASTQYRYRASLAGTKNTKISIFFRIFEIFTILTFRPRSLESSRILPEVVRHNLGGMRVSANNFRVGTPPSTPDLLMNF